MSYTRCDATGKVRYQTEPVAMLELKRASKRHERQNRLKIEKRHYFCKGCSGYHLTAWDRAS